MGLFAGLSVRYILAIETENGVATAGHGVAPRVKRAFFGIETENGILLVGHNIALR